VDISVTLFFYLHAVPDFRISHCVSLCTQFLSDPCHTADRLINILSDNYLLIYYDVIHVVQ